MIYRPPEHATGTVLRGRQGFVSILAVRGGRLLALLVKATNDPVTDAEAAWLGRLRRVPGIEAETVRPEQYSEVVRWLEPDRAR